MKTPQILIGIVAALALMFSIVAINRDASVVVKEVAQNLAGVTNYDTLDVSDGYKVDGTTIIDGSGNIATTGTINSDVTTTPITATTTIAASQSGTVFVIGTNGAKYTLPAVTNDGFYATFKVGSAFASTNAIIASAEGDNIEGTLIVAGAVVDCRGEDFVNFIMDGEAIGDTVTLVSDGTQWLIHDSNVLTTAKATCTDPS